MAYLNSELLELIIVATLPIALLYYFWESVPREKGLLIMTVGVSTIAFGAAGNYFINTPLISVMIELLGEENLGYIRPAFYFPGGILTFIGILGWFPTVVNYQEEIFLRKKAQSEVRDKNDLIAEVIETSKQGILLFDENYVVQLTNKRFLELLEIPEEIAKPGSTYRDLIQYVAEKGEYGDVDGETVYQQFLEIIHGAPAVHFQRVRPNGVILDIEAKWIPNMGLLSTYTDITHQASTELELSKSEEKFRDFSDSSSDWLWELDENLHFTYVSELGLAKSGRNLNEINNLSIRDLFFEGSTDDQWKVLATHLNNRKPFKDINYEYTHPNGKVLHFRTSGKPIFNKSGEFTGYRGTGSDITGRKHFEEQLQNSQKMEAIGRLSGGIAHDFNNLLAIILGNTELLKEHFEEKYQETIPMLNVIERASLRGADLTQQILAYSRKQKLRPSSIDLVTGMTSIVKLIGRSLGAEIDIHVHHVADLWNVHCDLGQLEDAIINLANNARDAMPKGGTITITTSNYAQVGTTERGDEETLQPGDYVVISVKDTGHGMSPETARQVFEPFFTTKDVGKGTGLGLSMVFGFAKQSNGHISIESELGTGTTVNLFLPRAETPDLLSKPSPSKSNSSHP